MLNAKRDIVQHSSCQTRSSHIVVVLPVAVHSALSRHCFIVVCVSSMTRRTLDCADHKPKYVKGYALLSESGYPYHLCLQPCERMDVFYLVYITPTQTEFYSPIKKFSIQDTNHTQLEQPKALNHENLDKHIMWTQAKIIYIVYERVFVHQKVWSIN